MDIMDAFSDKPKIKHTCIKDGCDYFYIADVRIHMICKLHSPERPVMRRDGKKEKDLSKFQKYHGSYMSWCNKCKKEENRLKSKRNKPQPLW